MTDEILLEKADSFTEKQKDTMIRIWDTMEDQLPYKFPTTKIMAYRIFEVTAIILIGLTLFMGGENITKLAKVAGIIALLYFAYSAIAGFFLSIMVPIMTHSKEQKMTIATYRVLFSKLAFLMTFDTPFISSVGVYFKLLLTAVSFASGLYFVGIVGVLDVVFTGLSKLILKSYIPVALDLKADEYQKIDASSTTASI
jgi:hypothetical protein